MSKLIKTYDHLIFVKFCHYGKSPLQREKLEYYNITWPSFCTPVPCLTTSWPLALTNNNYRNWEDDASLTQSILFTNYTQKLLFPERSCKKKELPCSRIRACPSARALAKGPSVSWLPSRATCFCCLPLHSQPPPAQHPGPHTCNNRTLCPAWIQADWLPLKPSTLGKDFHRFPLSLFITKPFLLYNTSDMWLASPFALIRSAAACRWKTTWLQPLAHSSMTNTYFKWMF